MVEIWETGDGSLKFKVLELEGLWMFSDGREKGDGWIELS